MLNEINSINKHMESLRYSPFVPPKCQKQDSKSSDVTSTDRHRATSPTCRQLIELGFTIVNQKDKEN
jgi:hypothetical protein